MRGWLVMLLVGCAGTGADPDPTDTDPVTFAGDVLEVFTRNCASSGCHSAVYPAEGLDLSDGGAYDGLVGVASFQVPGLDRVAPGDPDGSYLLHKVSGTHEGVGGIGDAMPPGFGLGAQDIAVLRAWIEAGAER